MTKLFELVSTTK